uniref:Uncharacterized protein n=1 Tax=Lotharella globosa TaxID=91324 RepID=A0A7S3ZBG9_9EUKA|mmetsp:Transcript_39277/g.75413  ORF Transcript_39277/g.75413 Transcript_39277/m.75413 type:complete len:247 (-) Transcript_39277:236-976(-)
MRRPMRAVTTYATAFVAAVCILGISLMSPDPSLQGSLSAPRSVPQMRTFSGLSQLSARGHSCPRSRLSAHVSTAATSEKTIEILDTAAGPDGSTKHTYGFRITGSDKKPFIQMSLEAPAGSELIPVTVGFPGLGVILEQKYLDDGPRIVVDDKEAKGTAIDVLEKGDVLRAFSAVYTVTPPTDVMAFYANPPKKVNVRGMYEVDANNFAKTIAALQSNGELVDRFGEKMEVNEISIVVERKKSPSA